MESLTAGRDYVTTQANSGASYKLQCTMYKLQILFLIIFILAAHEISGTSKDDKVLITDNFVINFNIETSPYTFAIA
jgi:hypothetical protein